MYSPCEAGVGEEEVRTWMLCLCSLTEAGSRREAASWRRSEAGEPEPWCRELSLSRASSNVNCNESWNTGLRTQDRYNNEATHSTQYSRACTVPSSSRRVRTK